MGYQQVKKPKFYIDMLSYFHATGNRKYLQNSSGVDLASGEYEDVLYGNPVSIVSRNIINSSGGKMMYMSSPEWEANKIAENCFPTFYTDFVAILNHNFGGLEVYVGSKAEDGLSEISFGSQTTPFDADKSVNINKSEDDYQTYNGFSLGVLTTPYKFENRGRIFMYNSADYDNENMGARYWGSFMVGKTWSPPHNPNLSMNITRKFDGIKSKRTQSGHTRADMDYIGRPLWAGHNPFELWNYDYDHNQIPPTTQTMFQEDPKANLSNMGRRSWKLTWDSVNETDLFNTLESSNLNDVFNDGTYDGVDNPFLEEESFLSRVWTPTLGGTLPFMMQIDDSNMNPDQFVIARFKKNSLTTRNKAPNLYSFSVDIEEVY